MFEDVPEDKLQELVFDSPVPVILDVAASWCQPCKYLKPILEEAVMRGGGAMRLVTIDADKRRQLAGAGAEAAGAETGAAIHSTPLKPWNHC